VQAPVTSSVHNPQVRSPSPDLKLLRQFSSEKFSSKNKNPRYFCPGSSLPAVQLCPDGRELQLQGILWDTVSAVRRGRATDTAKWLHEQLELSDSIYTPTAETIDHVLTRVRCWDLKLYALADRGSRWDAQSWSEIEALQDDIMAGKTLGVIHELPVRARIEHQYPHYPKRETGSVLRSSPTR
jgi:hypothetical protein